jgi:hypothetical protein
MSKEKLTVESVVNEMYDYNSSDIRGDNKKNIVNLLKQIRDEIILAEHTNAFDSGKIHIEYLDEVFNKYLNEK